MKGVEHECRKRTGIRGTRSDAFRWHYALDHITKRLMTLVQQQAELTKHLTLLGNTHSLAAAASGLGVLALHAQAPVVTQAAMVPAQQTACC